jgi:hypothetical protein
MSMPFKVVFVLAAFVVLTMRTSVDGFSSSSPPPSSSSSPIPPPPPISVPVWSFATASETKTSMNIMTFCIPVSVSSPKLWALSFYHGTLTKDFFLGHSCIQENNDANLDDDKNNVNDNGTHRSIGILQLLKVDHRYLVPILGKKSGRDIDKSILCSEEGFPWLRISASSNGDADVDTSANANANANGSDHISTQDCDFELLPGCVLYLQVECRSSTALIDAGDHVVAICEVTRIGVWEQKDDEELDGGKVRWLDQAIDGNMISLSLGGIDESNALYSGRLREEGIL